MNEIAFLIFVFPLSTTSLEESLVRSAEPEVLILKSFEEAFVLLLERSLFLFERFVAMNENEASFNTSLFLVITFFKLRNLIMNNNTFYQTLY